ncbi:MAG: RNB domain-containing ribonuclease [Cyanophyceae cyanobacterium]
MTNRFSVEEILAARSLDTTALLSQRPAARGITVDGETSMDLDDAFWVVPQDNGAVVYVYVADPTAAIAQDSVLDQMVRSRVTSRYFPWGVEPMLPPELSHGSLSLLPGQECPALELAIALDSSAAVGEVRWRFVRFLNVRRLSYGEADQVLNRPNDELFAQLSYGQIWAKKLSARRQAQGAIGAMVVGGVYYDEEGRATPQPLRSQMLIAELAILANVTVANILRDSGYPALFRNHGARQWDGSTASLVETLLGGTSEEAEALRNELSHDLNKAQYGATADGHFALAESAYCHSTSPLRRLADFVNHRVLHTIARNQPPPYTVEELGAIAHHINSTLEEEKEEIDDVHRRQRHGLYRRQLANGDRVRSLDDDEFIKLLHFALKEGDFEAVRDETLARLGRLGVAEWAALLLSEVVLEQEGAIAQGVCNCLIQSPELAISTLDILKSQKGWSVNFEITGQAHYWVARAVVNNAEEELTVDKPAGHRLKKQARAQAAIAWWSAHINSALIPITQAPALDATPPDVTKNPKPPQDFPQKSPLIAINKNFIGELNTYCQRRELPLPTEQFSQADNGEFICILGLEGVIAKGQGRTKKLAKQKAAYSLLQSLQA